MEHGRGIVSGARFFSARPPCRGVAGIAPSHLLIVSVTDVSFIFGNFDSSFFVGNGREDSAGMDDDGTAAAQKRLAASFKSLPWHREGVTRRAANF